MKSGIGKEAFRFVVAVVSRTDNWEGTEERETIRVVNPISQPRFSPNLISNLFGEFMLVTLPFFVCDFQFQWPKFNFLREKKKEIVSSISHHWASNLTNKPHY